MNHNANFFDWHIDTAIALIGRYDVPLVITSYLIATLAGYCAFSFNAVMTEDKSSRHAILQVVGGVALGLGIWAMHFTGMVAFSLPIEIKYQLLPTLVSILPAILISILALAINAFPIALGKKLAITSLLLTTGIAAMHFQGMTAMSLKADMVHDPVGFMVAVFVSWLMALVTVFVQYSDHGFLQNLSTRQRALISASAYGFSVASMHYLAMRATYFLANDQIENTSGLTAEALSFSIGLAVILLTCLLALVMFYRSKILGLMRVASTQHQYMVETLDNMADPYLLANPQGEVLLINHSFRQQFPFDQTQLAQLTSLSELKTYLIENIFEFSDDLERGRVAKKMERDVPIVLKQAGDKWWLFRQTTTTSGNCIQTWTNISEQKQTENKLIAARNESQEALIKLQQTQDELVDSQRLAAVGRLVANVSHELNTPLGITITSLSSIQLRLQDITERLNNNALTRSEMEAGLNDLTEFEKLASKNVARAENIVRQFKFLSLNEHTEQPSTVNLYNTVKHVLTALEEPIKRNKVDIQLNLDNKLNLISFQDGVFQVLSAIIGNAIFHAFLKVDHPQIKISCEDAEQDIVVTVEDNGVGIPNLIRDVVFDPFVTSKRSEGFIGLGLHIAYNLVTEQLKGKIDINHSTENGTKICVYLPSNIHQAQVDAIAL